MERFLKPLLCAAVAIIGAGAAQCFAEQEVGNIWWSLYDDYNGSNQSACVAENYNDHAVDALFEVSPTLYDFDGNPVPGRMLVTMAPYQTYKVFSRANATGPGPRCNNSIANVTRDGAVVEKNRRQHDAIFAQFELT